MYIEILHCICWRKDKIKGIFESFSLHIKQLQLCKFPCLAKIAKRRIWGILTDFRPPGCVLSNSPFCRNRDKSLQFKLKTRQEKSRLWCPNGIRAKKMVEDFSNRKTPNAKSAVLKNAINNSGVLHFLLFSQTFATLTATGFVAGLFAEGNDEGVVFVVNGHIGR